MKIITTIGDLRNIVDGWGANGDLSRDQIDDDAAKIRDLAHSAGLTYGDDWGPFLNTISFDDVLAFAEAA